MTDLFPGFGVGGYRCYGDGIEMVAPLDRLNVLIGANNAGKSATLRFVQELLNHSSGTARSNGDLTGFTTDDARELLGQPDVPFRVRLPLRQDEAELPAQLDSVLRDESGSAWLQFVAPSPVNGKLEADYDWIESVTSDLAPMNWNELSGTLTNTRGGAANDDRNRVIDYLRRERLASVPSEIVTIPAHREMRGGESDDWDFAGQGFIHKLKQIKNPEATEHSLRAQHDRLTASVQDVLELDSFAFHITNSNQLVLEIDSKRRALRAVGTGYEHVILLIAATIVFPNAFLCVEEPEVHLHPRLQRRMARYLHEQTSNQMLISTHSATLIDALGASVFQLQLIEGSTRVGQPVGHELVEGLNELGYRASDLLQANCVIWVEGPSDRIYVQWWLSSAAPDLIEGVHYSLMHYGGALLAGLSVDSEDSSDHDRIPLAPLNQHLFFVCDSDKKSNSSPLKDRVKRIQAEIKARGHGRVWVTAGRTIENYVAGDALLAGARCSNSTVTSLKPSNRWHEALRAVNNNGKDVSVSKVAVARAVAEGPVNLAPLDLQERVNELVDFVREANA